MDNSIYIGIDVSKSDLSIAYDRQGQWVDSKCENSIKAIRAFFKKCPSSQVHCVFEATGTYSSKLAFVLESLSIRFTILNPKQTHAFAKTLSSITKTDKHDARLLARFGQTMRPEPFKAKAEALDELRQLRTLLRQLKTHRQALVNQQHAFEQLPKQNRLVRKTLASAISMLSKQIQQVESQLLSITTDEFSAQVDLITSIKGFGSTLAVALIVTTGGINNFGSAKALAKFVGLAPIVHQSGTSVKFKGHISRSGDPQLRAMLYCATWSAIRFNIPCKELYNRLKADNKSSKLALVAVAHKLLRQAFGVVSNNSPFINDLSLAR